jgi:hypothetical protein
MIYTSLFGVSDNGLYFVFYSYSLQNLCQDGPWQYRSIYAVEKIEVSEKTMRKG